MTTRDLLVEIGTEELPPKALKKLSAAFTQGIVDGLSKAGLQHAAVQGYASPRRLAVLVSSLIVAQADKEVVRRGPALAAAFKDDGCASPAALGFAKSNGVKVEDLEKLETPEGAWLVFRKQEKGQATAALIPGIVHAALDALPIPKRMRWGNLSAQFVRPVHWVVLLFGDAVIDAEILGVRAGRETRGHRFLHPAKLYIGEPAAYAPLLETEGHVVADFAKRREAVRGQVLEAAAQLKGTAVIDDALLDEVTGMVEWPSAVTGNFEARFLSVPSEALISTMKANQKYFHVVDAHETLLPHFITIANIESRDVNAVRAGNERVVRPRLTDAAFFWDQDRKKKLADHLDGLKTVVFQNKLGSVYDKVERVAKLAGQIGTVLGANAVQCARAALLSKCDLLTHMVGEFPELQGIMGRYYAQHDGEAADVAQALDEQYLPRHAGDALPVSKVGQAVAIADKLDTLVGIFGIGQAPTGDKDPFALRRAALGALRIIIEQRLDLDLVNLLESAQLHCGDKLSVKNVATPVYDFMMERLRAYYADAGVHADEFEAVLAQRPAQPYDFDRRLRAVTAFRKLPEAASLSAANKRISNILKQAGGDISGDVSRALLKDNAERALADTLAVLSKEVTPLFNARDYESALQKLAALRATVDTFFDTVMVMADDPALRANRLALLGQLRALFLRVADISRLQM
jgi:glycyl-tRNA synthetase beta chain